MGGRDVGFVLNKHMSSLEIFFRKSLLKAIDV